MAAYWLMVQRSANCKTYATNCAKKMMPNSPNFVPPIPPNITIKKYQFRIDQDSTRIDNKKKVNEIVIRNSKLKR